MKGLAVLFGINYDTCKSGQLRGCVNDVDHMAEYLKRTLPITVECYTDKHGPAPVTRQSIVEKLYDVVIRSWNDRLDYVWLHYSGHGSYMRDYNGDEKDGKDECLVPVDYEENGCISDDYIAYILRYMNPQTKVILIFDCCHSATIADLPYSWEGPNYVQRENRWARIRAPVLSISGCMDHQTSADAWNVSGNREYSGAMTSCLLKCLQKKNEEGVALCDDVFALIDELRDELRKGKFTQIPVLCSTFNLRKQRCLFE